MFVPPISKHIWEVTYAVCGGDLVKEAVKVGSLYLVPGCVNELCEQTKQRQYVFTFNTNVHILNTPRTYLYLQLAAHLLVFTICIIFLKCCPKMSFFVVLVMTEAHEVAHCAVFEIYNVD